MERFSEFFINHWDLFAILAAILFMLLSGSVTQRLRGFKGIDPSGAVLLMNHDDAIYVDVRDESELKDGTVLGAIHIPLGQFGARMAELERYRERPIIVGCRSGSRSASACGKLKGKGFEQVYNLNGGMMAWQSAGLPLVKGNPRGKKRKA